MKKLASRLLDRLASAAQSARVARLSDDEKRAVLKLMHGVALADGVLSAAEDATLAKAAQSLGVTMTKELALPEAIASLSPASLKLACLLVADAFFVDGDYDAHEKLFVEQFATRFKLPQNPLKDAVEALRKKKLDDALEDWNKQIG